MATKRPTFDPRRAKPGQTFSYQELVTEKATGRTIQRERTIRADDDGVVWPKRAGDQAALDAFGLSVARDAKRSAASDQDDDETTGADETSADNAGTPAEED
jgi:hypothetical protein